MNERIHEVRLLEARIHEVIARAFQERSIDRRTCFVKVSAVPPGGRRIAIECSDGDVLGDIRGRLSSGVESETAELDFIRLPAQPAQAGALMALMAAASVVDVRRECAHSAELVTQLVYGDLVDLLKEEGEWTLARLDDGYIGWVRSWHLARLSNAAREDFCRKARHRVGEAVAMVWSEPSEDALPVSDVVIGTPMVAESCARRGWRRVTLPDGKRGFMPGSSLCSRARAGRAITGLRSGEKPRAGLRGGEKLRASLASTGPGAAAANEKLRAGLASTALKLLGIPYVWGGTTPKGFDCSGFTQRVYRLHGILIPRDADMQARFGRIEPRPIDTEKIPTGALLFFGKSRDLITHVALALPKQRFIHARGLVRLNSLSPSDSLFDESLFSDWQLVGDPLGR